MKIEKQTRKSLFCRCIRMNNKSRSQSSLQTKKKGKISNYFNLLILLYNLEIKLKKWLTIDPHFTCLWL